MIGWMMSLHNILLDDKYEYGVGLLRKLIPKEYKALEVEAYFDSPSYTEAVVLTFIHDLVPFTIFKLHGNVTPQEAAVKLFQASIPHVTKLGFSGKELDFYKGWMDTLGSELFKEAYDEYYKADKHVKLQDFPGVSTNIFTEDAVDSSPVFLKELGVHEDVILYEDGKKKEGTIEGNEQKYNPEDFKDQLNSYLVECLEQATSAYGKSQKEKHVQSIAEHMAEQHMSLKSKDTAESTEYNTAPPIPLGKTNQKSMLRTLAEHAVNIVCFWNHYKINTGYHVEIPVYFTGEFGQFFSTEKPGDFEEKAHHVEIWQVYVKRTQKGPKLTK